MDDWRNIYEAQCREEGLDVPDDAPRKSLSPPPENSLETNVQNKEVKTGGPQKAGGGFGIGAGKLINSAPPPQTSFGLTASRGSTMDARGPPIGSPEFEEGTSRGKISVAKNGNIQSKVACNVRYDNPSIVKSSASARIGGAFGSKTAIFNTKKVSDSSDMNSISMCDGLNKGIDACAKPSSNSIERSDVTGPTVGGGLKVSRTAGGGFGKPKNIAPPEGLSKPETISTEKSNGISGIRATGGSIEAPKSFVNDKSAITSGKSNGSSEPVIEKMMGNFTIAPPKTVGGGFRSAKPVLVPKNENEGRNTFGVTSTVKQNAPMVAENEQVDRFAANRNNLAKSEYSTPTAVQNEFRPNTRNQTAGARSINENQKENESVPFMSSAPPIATRGDFRGGMRGGRGRGDFNNFGGQVHGRPEQRSMSDFQNAPPFIPQNQKLADDIHDKAPLPEEIALLNKYIHKEVPMIADGNVTVDRMDPRSPLYAVGSFKELRLKKEVLDALEILGFELPTRIQETALPLLLMEPPSNLIAQAQSGTGKTAAFVLTMLCRIDTSLECPQCICLAPTLELAKQIGSVVQEMGQCMPQLKIGYAIKSSNMPVARNKKLTEQIIIGTPGTTRDYLFKYKIIDPSRIKCLVLDEADVMIYHQGFTDISTSIYNLIQEASPNVQSMLFSATYDAPVVDFATSIVKDAIVVMLKREEQALPNIKQFYIECPSRETKFNAISNLYSGLTIASSVIFCHTKSSVMWLATNMTLMNHKVGILHGEMTVEERADSIKRFKAGEFRVLITTNVFARGIDVAQVSIVINYDLPLKYDANVPFIIDDQIQPDCDTYLHRIGRTGRFGKKGIAVNFVSGEKEKNMIHILENHFQMEISPMDPTNMIQLESIEV